MLKTWALLMSPTVKRNKIKSRHLLLNAFTIHDELLIINQRYNYISFNFSHDKY